MTPTPHDPTMLPGDQARILGLSPAPIATYRALALHTPRVVTMEEALVLLWPTMEEARR